MNHLKLFEDSFATGSVYMIIDSEGHSYEAILGVYSTFYGAMLSNVWEEREETPDERGHGDTLFIHETKIQH